MSPACEGKTPTRPACPESKSATGPACCEGKSPTEPTPSTIAPPTLGAIAHIFQNLLNDAFDRTNDLRGLHGPDRVEVTTRYNNGVDRRLADLLCYDVGLNDGPSTLSLRGGGQDLGAPPWTARKRLRAEEKKERDREEKKAERKVSQMARVGSPADHARIAGQATERANREAERLVREDVEVKVAATMEHGNNWFPTFRRRVEGRVRSLITQDPNITPTVTMAQALDLIEKANTAERARYGLGPDTATADQRHRRLPDSTRGEPRAGWRSGPAENVPEGLAPGEGSVDRPVDLTAEPEAGEPAQAPHPLHASALNFGARREEARILLEARLRNIFYGEMCMAVSTTECDLFFTNHPRLRLFLDLLACAGDLEEEMAYAINHIAHDHMPDTARTLRCLHSDFQSDVWRWRPYQMTDGCLLDTIFRVALTSDRTNHMFNHIRLTEQHSAARSNCSGLSNCSSVPCHSLRSSSSDSS